MIMLASQVRGAWLVDTSLGKPVGEISDLILSAPKLQLKYIRVHVPGAPALYAREDHLQWQKTLGLIRSANLLGDSEDFIRDQAILRTACNLLGYKVVDENAQTIGKVVDFAFTAEDGRIARIMVQPAWWQAIKHTERILSRSHIREVNPEKRLVTIVANAQKVTEQAAKPVPA